MYIYIYIDICDIYTHLYTHMHMYICKWMSLQIGVLCVGLLAIRDLLFRIHIRAPGFWNLPYMDYTEFCLKGYQA